MKPPSPPATPSSAPSAGLPPSGFDFMALEHAMARLRAIQMERIRFLMTAL
jgi:hypothetical protein